jgi:sugar lactone lactonase YvrE
MTPKPQDARQASLLFALCAAIAAAACGGSQPPPAEPAPPPPAPPPPAAAAAPAPAPSPAASTIPEAKPAAPQGPAPAAKYTGFSTPESVLYDEAGDRYLVSNINGNPSDADGNGFISVLSPDGQVTNAKWIAGGANKVKLDAPKGMAIAQGVLYVADITNVRKFDLKTGAPKGDVPIAGSTFLNDVSAGADGKIYVSDTGVKATPKGMEPTGTDAVYVIDKGKVKPLAKSKELGGPNGVLATDKGVLVVTFGSGELYRLDKDGKKADVTKLPEGGLDGVVSLGDTLLVSSWKGSAVYRGKLGGSFEIAIGNLKSPADIGYDKKRGRVLVPHFMEDTVEAYELK